MVLQVTVHSFGLNIQGVPEVAADICRGVRICDAESKILHAPMHFLDI